MNIRPIERGDLPDLKNVLTSSELFSAELLDDMIADFFDNEDSADIWFTVVDEDRAIAIAYCAPERMTTGTYNLYAIAVHRDHQGKGIGKQMMAYLENLLQQSGHRILLVETSGLADYALTREFYHKCQYTQEATIRDFYAAGEDKIVFWKKL